MELREYNTFDVEKFKRESTDLPPAIAALIPLYERHIQILPEHHRAVVEVRPGFWDVSCDDCCMVIEHFAPYVKASEPEITIIMPAPEASHEAETPEPEVA